MRKYSEPEIEIREYKLAADKILTEGSNVTGNPENNLHDDDEYDYFGNN